MEALSEAKPLRGRSVLVTGSTGGLGLAIAGALARQGCDIMLTGLTDAAAFGTTLDQFRADHGCAAEYVRKDLTSPEGVSELVSAVADAFGSVDILVNNAVVRYAAPVEAFAVRQWEHALAVNLSAPFLAIKYAMPLMKQNGYGTIINVSSVHGLFGTVNRIDYVATKTALVGMTKAVALEAREHDITCNAICPGSVLTPHSNGKIEQLMAMEGLDRGAAERKFLRDRGHSRFVSGAGIGAFIGFLSSPVGRDITGAIIPIDAGYSAGHASDLGGGGTVSTADMAMSAG